MPYPSISFRTELDPVVRKELDALSVQHEEFLSKEHNPDGTHSNITADSAVIAGDVTVGGSVGFEDLSGNTINCVTLHVDGQTTTDGNITSQGGVTALFISASGPATSGVSLSVVDTTLNGAGTTLYVQPVDSGLSVVNVGDPAAPAGGGAATLTVFGTISGINAISVSKFSVDTETGNTLIAGTLGVTGTLTATGSLTAHTDFAAGPWGGGSSYTAVSLNGSLATGAYNLLSKAGDTNLYINRPSGKQITFGENNNQSDLIIKTGGQIQLNTFYTSAGVLVVDASGNVTRSTSITTNVTGNLTGTASGNTVGTGVGAGSFTSADLKTVSYNADGLITSVV